MSTECRRPVGLFTNFAWVKSQMVPRWPSFRTVRKVGRQLCYDGPLCPQDALARRLTFLREAQKVTKFSIPFLPQDSANFFGHYAEIPPRSPWGKRIFLTLLLLYHSLSQAPSASPFFFLWMVWFCLRSLRCVVSWCTHSKFPHRSCWLRFCFGVLQTLEIQRLLSLLQCETSGSGLQMARSTSSAQAPGPLERLLVTFSPRGDGGKHGSGRFDERSESPQERLQMLIVSSR